VLVGAVELAVCFLRQAPIDASAIVSSINAMSLFEFIFLFP
jgi:hypothetical protein